MMITLDALGMLGAEVFVKDGVRYVAWPIDLNGTEVMLKNGEPAVLTKFWLNPTKRGRAHYKGKQCLSPEIQDRILENPDLIPRRVCMWGYETHSKSPVSREDFLETMNDEG